MSVKLEERETFVPGTAVLHPQVGDGHASGERPGRAEIVYSTKSSARSPFFIYLYIVLHGPTKTPLACYVSCPSLALSPLSPPPRLASRLKQPKLRR